MPVSFSTLKVGGSYSRAELADTWGYASLHAIARGVVTPRDDNKIILFVTEVKKTDRTQYRDRLIGDTLHWEGPTDHFAEGRMINAQRHGEQIHLFYREVFDQDFTYKGQVQVTGYTSKTDGPSSFVLKVDG